MTELNYVRLSSLPVHQYTGTKNNIVTFLRLFTGVVFYPVEGREEPDMVIHTQGLHRSGYKVRPTDYVIIDTENGKLFILTEMEVRNNFPKV